MKATSPRISPKGGKLEAKGAKSQTVDEFVLEKVSGVSCASSNAIAANPTNSTIAFSVSSVLVMLDPRHSEQEFVKNPTGRCIKAVAFSDDGKYVAFGEMGYNPKIFIYGAADRKRISEFQLSGMCSIKAVEFHFKSVYLAVLCSSSFSIGLFDLKGKRMTSARFVVEPLGMTLPKVGAYLVVCGQRKVSLFSLIDVNTAVCNGNIVFERRSVLLGHQGNYTFVDVTSGEGTHERKVYTVTSCGYLCDIRVGDILIDNATKIDDRCFCVKYANGCLFVGCARNTVRICSPANLSVLQVISDRDVFEASLHLPKILKFEADTIALAVNSTTSVVTCVFSDNRRHSWRVDLTKSPIECTGIIPVDSEGKEVPWEPTCYQIQGKVASVLNRRPSSGQKSSKAAGSKDGGTNKPAANPDPLKPTAGHLVRLASRSASGPSYVNATRFTPDGKIVCGNAEGEIKVYDAVTGRLNRVIEAHSSAVTHIELLWDDHFWLVASGGRDRVIFILDAKKDHSLVQVLCDHSSAIVSISMAHHNGTLTLVSSAADGVILIRRAIKGKNLRFVIVGELAEFGGKPRIYAYGNDYIITGGDHGQINFFQTEPYVSTKPTRTILSATKGKRYMKAVAIDPSGCFLVANSTNGTLVFNIQNGKHVATLPKMLNMSLITFTNDCKYLVNESNNGCRFLWRIPQRMSDVMKAKIEEGGNANTTATANTSGTTATSPTGHFLYNRILSSVDVSNQKNPTAYNYLAEGNRCSEDRQEYIAVRSRNTDFQNAVDTSCQDLDSPSESDLYSCCSTCSRSYTDVINRSPDKLSCRFPRNTSQTTDLLTEDYWFQDDRPEFIPPDSPSAKPTESTDSPERPTSTNLVNSISYLIKRQDSPSRCSPANTETRPYFKQSPLSDLGKSPSETRPFKARQKLSCSKKLSTRRKLRGTCTSEISSQLTQPSSGVDDIDVGRHTKETSHASELASPTSVYLSSGSRQSIDQDECPDLSDKQSLLTGVAISQSPEAAPSVEKRQSNTATLSQDTIDQEKPTANTQNTTPLLERATSNQSLEAENGNTSSSQESSTDTVDSVKEITTFDSQCLDTPSTYSERNLENTESSTLTKSKLNRDTPVSLPPTSSPEKTAASLEVPGDTSTRRAPLPDDQFDGVIGDGDVQGEGECPKKEEIASESTVIREDANVARTGDGDFPAANQTRKLRDVNHNTAAVNHNTAAVNHNTAAVTPNCPKELHTNSSYMRVKRSYSHVDKKSWNVHCNICLERAKQANLNDAIGSGFEAADEKGELDEVLASAKSKDKKVPFSHLSNSQETFFDLPKYLNQLQSLALISSDKESTPRPGIKHGQETPVGRGDSTLTLINEGGEALPINSEHGSLKQDVSVKPDQAVTPCHAQMKPEDVNSRSEMTEVKIDKDDCDDSGRGSQMRVLMRRNSKICDSPAMIKSQPSNERLRLSTVVKCKTQRPSSPRKARMKSTVERGASLVNQTRSCLPIATFRNKQNKDNFLKSPPKSPTKPEKEKSISAGKNASAPVQIQTESISAPSNPKNERGKEAEAVLPLPQSSSSKRSSPSPLMVSATQSGGEGRGEADSPKQQQPSTSLESPSAAGSNPSQSGVIEGLGSVLDLFRNQDDYLRKLREVRRNFEMSIQALREDRENRQMRSLRQKKEE